jgi:2-oxoglutarate dehydrogenase E1 component
LPSTRQIYADRLAGQGVLEADQSGRMVDDYRKSLEGGTHVVKSLVREPNKTLFVDWTPYLGHEYSDDCDSGVSLERMKALAKSLETVPEGFVLQKQVEKIIEDRAKMVAGAMPINWGFGETMAYATLLDQGYAVRLTGQDVGRGTFSHRHAVLHSQKDGSRYVPLQHIRDDQPRFDIYDSLLSEEAVLAFEYGYSTTTPGGLVIWEAQFGDFANGAQVVIDQFISSGENKWERLCGLTLLLPHGYEGQGPEHSSARLERFLQLCAENNMQVCTPTTPAQIFHLLRRQAIRPLRKPLVIMSPKSLLRHRKAISTLEDLAEGGFRTVLGDIAVKDPKKVTRLILCGGKVFYDLDDKREADGRDDVAIVRIEQLYPFPEQRLAEVIAPYRNLERVIWCQEEPQNQGAWYCSQHHMRNVLRRHDAKLHVEYAGRASSASPAAGYASLHAREQEQLVNDAFSL